MGGPGLDFQSWETLEDGVGENEKRPIEIRGSHPSLEKREGWAIQLYGLVKGAPPGPPGEKSRVLVSSFVRYLFALVGWLYY
jgi:hypothetical protein